MSFATGKKIYLKNLFSSYLPYLVQILITIIITPLLIKTFGQEKYGVYVLLNTFIAYFTLSNIGLPQTLIREMIHQREKKNFEKIDQMISSTFFYYLIVVSLVVVINLVLFYADVFHLNKLILNTENLELLQSFAIGMLLVSILFGIKLITEIFDAIVKATNKIYITQIVKFISVVLLGISTYLALKFYGTIEAVLVSNTIVSLFVLVLLFKESKKLINFKIDYKMSSFKVFKEMLPSSFWYFIGGISVLLIYQTDNIILSSFLGVSSVAVFAITYKISNLIKQLVLQISNVTFSYFSKINLDNKIIKKQLITMMFVMFVLSIILYSTVYFLLEDIVKIWLKDLTYYEPKLFLIILITHILQLVISPLSIYAGAKDIHKNIVQVGLIQGIINIGLSILLVSEFGMYGVVFATLISFTMTNFVFNIYFILYKTLGEK